MSVQLPCWHIGTSEKWRPQKPCLQDKSRESHGTGTPWRQSVPTNLLDYPVCLAFIFSPGYALCLLSSLRAPSSPGLPRPWPQGHGTAPSHQYTPVPGAGNIHSLGCSGETRFLLTTLLLSDLGTFLPRVLFTSSDSHHLLTGNQDREHHSGSMDTECHSLLSTSLTGGELHALVLIPLLCNPVWSRNISVTLL